MTEWYMICLWKNDLEHKLPGTRNNLAQIYKMGTATDSTWDKNQLSKSSKLFLTTLRANNLVSTAIQGIDTFADAQPAMKSYN